MRITGGVHSGRKIACPPGVIRPTMGRMRESLFATLGSLEGFTFLDLFSGSGVMGIEAASRGAILVHLVEADRRKKDLLMKNVRFLTTPLRCYIGTVERYLRTAKISFDIIYLDPPFDRKRKWALLEEIDRTAILKREGVALMHHPSEDEAPSKIGRLTLGKEKKYGRSRLAFYHYDQDLSLSEERGSTEPPGLPLVDRALPVTNNGTMKQFKVQFVCAGNICRSPLAHAVFQKKVKEEGETGRILVNSSGTGDWHVGALADERMRQVAKGHGVEITHRGRCFSLDDWEGSDLVLVMDRQNYHDVCRLSSDPLLHEKVKFFREFDPHSSPRKDDEVPDPYYGGKEGFEEVYQMVERTVPLLLEFIRRGLKKND